MCMDRAVFSVVIPEPVLNLSVVLRPNGTGVVSWIPSAEQENILFYQIIYYALQHENGCQTRHEALNVKAASTSVTVDFAGQRCEYVVRLVNYDLIGRDAVAEIRVLVEHEAPTPRLDVMLQSEAVIIPIALVLFFCLCMTIRCFCNRNCPSIDPEKQEKLHSFV
ncbi:unnamed protein product [Cylicostephanus goldi]|uniref:Fibronectin type-III domain-containing protein n=1 Tax=Cylicostephanus goldi TaxID=71465 RepID=A0A3P6TUH6_CYLGO|nr:unnamed protein product [Cylicostephanus goldi]